MAIEHQILGEPGRDNALLATVDTGHSVHPLLFDCGQGCLTQLQLGQVAAIEALFFSHFHMDHIAGFDSFVRVNWDRADEPVRIFGPPGTVDIIHHRLRGYIWNLAAGTPAEWLVTEVCDEHLHHVRLLSTEGFAECHELETTTRQDVIYSNGSLEVSAIALDHGTTSLGYCMRESDRSNIDAARLPAMGLSPGPWLKELKDSAGIADGDEIDVNGTPRRAGELRSALLQKTRGESIAYLTDFHLKDRAAEDQLVEFLDSCQTIVCENNYRNAEAALAANYHHLTAAEVGALARRVDPERLVLFHLSDRYTEEEWLEQIEEVRDVFPRVEFPAGWDFGG